MVEHCTIPYREGEGTLGQHARELARAREDLKAAKAFEHFARQTLEAWVEASAGCTCPPGELHDPCLVCCTHAVLG